MYTFKVEPALTTQIKQIIIEHHYLHSCPLTPKYIFAIYDGDEIVGAALVSGFSRFQAKSKYKDCLELNRFIVLDKCPKNTESFFLGSLLRYLKENSAIKGIVSYADPSVDHDGTIYKAANFRFIGNSAKSYHYIDKDGKWINKKVVWDRAKQSNLSEKEYSENQSYEKISEEKKLIYFYELIKGYLDKLLECDFDLDVVFSKKVNFHKTAKKWMAHVKTKSSKQYIGYFSSEEDAWIACDKFEEDFKGKKYQSAYKPEEVKNHDELPNSFNKDVHTIIRIGPRIFFIDKEDLDFVLSRRWNTYSTYMRLSNSFGSDEKSFHRRILNAPDGLVVDHINGMKNDNRRINLRAVKHSLNNHNVDRPSNRKYFGVRFSHGKYEANIRFNYKPYYIGRFDKEDDAAKAYDMKAVEFFGSMAKTNFPISDYSMTENPLIDDVEIKSFKLSEKRKCSTLDCKNTLKSVNKDICDKCTMKQMRVDIATAQGRTITKYVDRVETKEKLCVIEGCENPVNARNLCSNHYHHARKHEENYRKNPKTIYPCIFPGCEAQYQHKENLCLVHWREKNGIEQGKRTGRPGKEMVDCKECGKPQSATQPSLLCPKCYGRWYRAQNPDKRLKKNQD